MLYQAYQSSRQGAVTAAIVHLYNNESGDDSFRSKEYDIVDPNFASDLLDAIETLDGPSGGAARIKAITKGAGKKISSEPPIQQIDPKNLIPTQTRNEISGSQVKRLKKDMQRNGFDQSQPVDVVRNPRGRLEIQDGHHRTEAARKAGLDKIPVRIWGDVD